MDNDSFCWLPANPREDYISDFLARGPIDEIGAQPYISPMCPRTGPINPDGTSPIQPGALGAFSSSIFSEPDPGPYFDVPESPPGIWHYAVNVWPACDKPGEDCVYKHFQAIHENLLDSGIDDYRYELVLACDSCEPLFGHRRYTAPFAARGDDHIRYKFLQTFNTSKSYNQLRGYRFEMSVVYVSRTTGLVSGPRYPANADDEVDGKDQNIFSDNPDDVLEVYESLPTSSPPSISQRPELEGQTPQRNQPIPKPDREVTKNAEGRYVCTYPNCNDKEKVFDRKCNWTKHMDKHERPYKCPAEGCEKMRGFTYSGGLLRHQREVHQQHGGPKNPLNCPHTTCKRNSGKGFSRLENLNEHLRRCHTSTSGNNIDDRDDNVSIITNEHVTVGEKRKADDEDLREEVKRLREVNQVLEQNVNIMGARIQALEHQVLELKGSPPLGPLDNPSPF